LEIIKQKYRLMKKQRDCIDSRLKMYGLKGDMGKTEKQVEEEKFAALKPMDWDELIRGNDNE
jgi:hypothetical protein